MLKPRCSKIWSVLKKKNSELGAKLWILESCPLHSPLPSPHVITPKWQVTIVLTWSPGARGSSRVLFQTNTLYLFSCLLITLDPHIVSVFVFLLHLGSYTISMIFQTEPLFGQTELLSLSNRASVLTKQGLHVCLKSLLVFFTRLCLNPDLNS